MRRFALPTEKVRVIPNLVELGRFRSQKLPEATFNVGMIGFVDSRKRLDLALDVIERLRAADPRFRLILKGKPPWEFPWVWQREEERRYYERVYQRMARSPLLREAVTFDPFGPDVPGFLEKVRFLISTSDSEGDQVAVAEAAASGAIPVVLVRPGAAEQYPSSWVHDSPDAAAGAILDVVYSSGSRLKPLRRSSSRRGDGATRALPRSGPRRLASRPSEPANRRESHSSPGASGSTPPRQRSRLRPPKRRSFPSLPTRPRDGEREPAFAEPIVSRPESQRSSRRGPVTPRSDGQFLGALVALLPLLSLFVMALLRALARWPVGDDLGGGERG